MKKIEFQYFNGCPNSDRMLQNTLEALKEISNEFVFSKILIDSETKAAEYNFRGSPTLLVNGTDYENLPIPEIPSFSCRYYQIGIPTTEKIKFFIESIDQNKRNGK